MHRVVNIQLIVGKMLVWLELTFCESCSSTSWLTQYSGAADTQHDSLGMAENCRYLIAACQ